MVAKKIKPSFFREIYFWLCVYFITFYTKLSVTRTEGTVDASIFLSLLKFANIIVIYFVILTLLSVKVSPSPIYIIIFLILISIYDHFAYAKRRDEIFRLYNEYDEERQKKGKIIFWTYLSITLLPYILGIGYVFIFL